MAYTPKRLSLTTQPVNGTISVYNSTTKLYVDTVYNNIYLADGTLVSARTITTGGFDLSLSGTGKLIVAADIQANSGSITTTQTTGNLFNTTATTLNIGGAATTVSIGASTGTTTINSANTVITGNLTVNGTTDVFVGTTQNFGDKNLSLGYQLTTDAAADGAGITVNGATIKTFNWINATNAFSSSVNMALLAGSKMIFNGSTSGADSIVASAAAPSVSYILPATAPTAGQFLASSAAGQMTWTTASQTYTGATKTAAYTLLTADEKIILNSATATVTVDPTTITAYKTYTVKCITATPTTAGLTLSSGTIDGAASFVFTSQYESISFYSDGTNLFIQ